MKIDAGVACDYQHGVPICIAHADGMQSAVPVHANPCIAGLDASIVSQKDN